MSTSVKPPYQLAGERIYGWLTNPSRLGTGFTYRELRKGARLADLSNEVIRRGIRYARQLATEEGYHFPPAIDGNGYQYMVTSDVNEAVLPTLRMQRIESGVRRRKEVGRAFLAVHESDLDPSTRPAVKTFLSFADAADKAHAAIADAMDELSKQTADHVKELERQQKAGKP